MTKRGELQLKTRAPTPTPGGALIDRIRVRAESRLLTRYARILACDMTLKPRPAQWELNVIDKFSDDMKTALFYRYKGFQKTGIVSIDTVAFNKDFRTLKRLRNRARKENG